MPGNEGHTFHCRAAFTRARHNKEKLTSYPLDSQCPNIENSGSFLGRPAGPCGGKTPTEAGGARTRPAYKRTENMHNTTKKILKMRRSRGTAEGNLSKWLRVFVAERSETKTPECGIACVTIETKFQLKVHSDCPLPSSARGWGMLAVWPGWADRQFCMTSHGRCAGSASASKHAECFKLLQQKRER